MSRLIKIIACLACVLLFQTSFAQIGNNWVFGQFAGLDFGEIPPKPFESNIHSYSYSTGDTVNARAASSISDCQGNLLFYTDGCKIWDSTHQIMSNGNLGCYGTTNTKIPLSSYIIPKPGSNTKFYVFYSWEEKSNRGFHYSLIDMSRGNGKGKVIQKNQLIKKGGRPTGFLTVIEHENNKDYWLVFLYNTGNIVNRDYKFFVYPVTKNGIGSPNIQNVNIDINRGAIFEILKNTPNGEHLLLKARNQYGFNNFIALVNLRSSIKLKLSIS